MSLREKLKKIALLKYAVITARTFEYRPSLFKRIKSMLRFLNDYRRFQRIHTNMRMLLQAADLYPCLYDNTNTTPLDPIYFYQDTWCAAKIFEAKPKHHYDIASKAEMVGIVSQFTPTTMIDIRPLPVTLKNLSFVQGDILHLPFADDSIASLSCICVLEHIGLGRYGDPLDPFGSEKAIQEMKRVLAPGGSLYISVPVDAKNKVYFNAHRAFTRNYMLEQNAPLVLVEEKYIYGNELVDHYQAARGFGTGLYYFRKALI